MCCLNGLAEIAVDCKACSRLTAELERRKREYAVACSSLDMARKNSDQVQYQQLSADCGDALIDCDFARLELEEHRTVHARVQAPALRT